MSDVASRGSLEVFKFLMSKGIKINQHIMGSLATRGQFTLIKNMYTKTVPIISLTGQIGNTTVTRFFNRNKQELDYTTIHKGLTYGTFEVKQSFVISKTHNNTILLKDIDGIVDPDGIVSIDCTIYNQLPPIDEGTIQTVARHGHQDLLKFLISKQAPVDEDAMYDSIIRGFTEITILLYQYRPVINHWHIKLANLWNRHEILHFFKEKPVITTDKIPGGDASTALVPFDFYGKSIYEILSYACAQGDLATIKQYRGSVHIRIHILPFGRININIHDYSDMFYVAILNGQWDVMIYLAHRVIKDSKYTACATRIGRMDMLRYLVEEQFPVCEKSMINAIEKCRMDCVKYLVAIGAPRSPTVLEIARKHNADEIWEFLKNCSG